MHRRLGALACIAFTALLPGCGGDGGEHLIGADALRDCLAKHGVRFGAQRAGATGYAPLFHLAADLEGSISGSSIEVFIEKSMAAAHRDAADAKGALASVGISDPGGRVVGSRNAVVVFEPSPSTSARGVVRSCLTGR